MHVTQDDLCRDECRSIPGRSLVLLAGTEEIKFRGVVEHLCDAIMVRGGRTHYFIADGRDPAPLLRAYEEWSGCMNGAGDGT